MKKKFITQGMVILVLCASYVMIFPASALSQEVIGYVRPLVGFETPHPYAPSAIVGAVIWRDILRVPDAKFLKLHFSNFSLAGDDYVVVRDPVGVYAETLTNDRGNDIWALSVFGDQVIVELYSVSGSVGSGFIVPEYVYGFAAPDCGAAGLCGEGNIECANGNSSHQWIYNWRRPVCRVTYVKNGTNYSCTGWIIARPNRIITNFHCLENSPSICQTAEALFNQECIDCPGSYLKPWTRYGCTQIVCGEGALDYTIFEVRYQPAISWGQLRIDPRPITVGEPVGVPNHSLTREKQYDAAIVTQVDGLPPCTLDVDDDTYIVLGVNRIQQSARIAGGASGSPVMKKDTYAVIGLLHTGPVVPGCGDWSRSVKMSSIWADMQTWGCTQGVDSWNTPRCTQAISKIEPGTATSLRVEYSGTGGTLRNVVVTSNPPGCGPPIILSLGSAVYLRWPGACVDQGEMVMYEFTVDFPCEGVQPVSVEWTYQVPTLTEWGLIILVGLIVFSTWVIFRRRKAVVSGR